MFESRRRDGPQFAQVTVQLVQLAEQPRAINHARPGPGRRDRSAGTARNPVLSSARPRTAPPRPARTGLGPRGAPGFALGAAAPGTPRGRSRRRRKTGGAFGPTEGLAGPPRSGRGRRRYPTRASPHPGRGFRTARPPGYPGRARPAPRGEPAGGDHAHEGMIRGAPPARPEQTGGYLTPPASARSLSVAATKVQK